MNKKLIGILLILISLIIALIFMYLIFFYQPQPQIVVVEVPVTPVVPVATSSKTIEPPIVLPKPKETTPAPANEVAEEDARQVAIAFAQLYGSYSNQGDLSRINDLKFYVTSQYLDVIAKQIKSINDNYKVYTGYTTRAITTQPLIIEENRAVMMVTTRRSEGRDGGDERVFNQDIKVELTRIGNSWRVENSVWQ